MRRHPRRSALQSCTRVLPVPQAITAVTRSYWRNPSLIEVIASS